MITLQSGSRTWRVDLRVDPPRIQWWHHMEGWVDWTTDDVTGHRNAYEARGLERRLLERARALQLT